MFIETNMLKIIKKSVLFCFLSFYWLSKKIWGVIPTLASIATIGALLLGYLSLLTSADPDVAVYQQNINPGQDLNFTDAPGSKAGLILKNNFPGPLKKIQIFKTYFAIAQDPKTLEMWACYLDADTNPISEFSYILPLSKDKFTVDYGYEYKKIPQKTAVLPVLRLRVIFHKGLVGGEPIVRDFYYDVLDNRTIIDFKNFQLSTNILTKTGTMNREDVISFLKPLTFSSLDIRCFSRP